MQKYIIEDGIPLERYKDSVTNQLRQMKIGQSFVAVIEDRPKLFIFAKRAGISISTHQLDKVNMRVWRIEDRAKKTK